MILNPDLTNSTGTQLVIGQRFKAEGDGNFSFHTDSNDLFKFHKFVDTMRVCEMVAYGDVVTEGNYSTCIEFELTRELPWSDVLALVNNGKNNTGRRNSGDLNSGDLNSGDLNSGDLNSGDLNSGDLNSGDRNSGDLNSGDLNSGDLNSGDRNSGDRNSGDRNSGDRNSGDRNSGVFNKTNFSSGVFCSVEQPAMFFNKPGTMTLREFFDTEAYGIINEHDFPLTEWVDESRMTDQQKTDNPKFFVMGGYLKVNSYEYACKAWWDSLSSDEQDIIQQIPGFDKQVFFEVTGIQL